MSETSKVSIFHAARPIIYSIVISIEPHKELKCQRSLRVSDGNHHPYCITASYRHRLILFRAWFYRKCAIISEKGELKELRESFDGHHH